MKVRLGFVTNSSSSSFIITKKNLTEKQIQAIRIHDELGEKLRMHCSDERWIISESENYISGETFMDNFSMSNFFDHIGVSNGYVTWDEFVSADEMDDPGVDDCEDDDDECENKTWEDYLDEL